jgi:hypothetical protein
MASLGTLSASGQNGSTYDFKVYPLGTTFDPVSAVYLITQRTPEFGNGGSHTYIYIGETNDLSACFNNHHKASCFEDHNANCICIHREDREPKRLRIKNNIYRRCRPHCDD